MLIVFPPIVVADTKINCVYNLVAPSSANVSLKIYMLFYKQHFHKQRQDEIGKKSSKG